MSRLLYRVLAVIFSLRCPDSDAQRWGRAALPLWESHMGGGACDVAQNHTHWLSSQSPLKAQWDTGLNDCADKLSILHAPATVIAFTCSLSATPN